MYGEEGEINISKVTPAYLCRGVIVINASLSFELQPEERDEGVRRRGRSEEEKDLHTLYPTHQLSSESEGCGVSHTFIPPIQINPQIYRVRGVWGVRTCAWGGV